MRRDSDPAELIALTMLLEKQPKCCVCGMAAEGFNVQAYDLVHLGCSYFDVSYCSQCWKPDHLALQYDQLALQSQKREPHGWQLKEFPHVGLARRFNLLLRLIGAQL
jgi:hypothetical protein